MFLTHLGKDERMVYGGNLEIITDAGCVRGAIGEGVGGSNPGLPLTKLGGGGRFLLPVGNAASWRLVSVFVRLQKKYFSVTHGEKYIISMTAT